MNLKAFVKLPILPISMFYFLARFINLLTLPIFNDEAIYIDWGTKELSSINLLYYSLYDGKPPLLMWLFGFAHKFISDPLLAARAVSVMAGFLTLIGLYKLAEKIFNPKVAVFSAIFYTITPLFTFFDRQALMESSIGAIGIWSIYFFIKFLEKPTLKNSILLGTVWGVGLFIKQTAIVFVIAQTAIYLWLLLKTKSHKFNWNSLATLYMSQIILIPLYLQKNFWSSLSGNVRFTLGLGEIFSFPLGIWFSNLQNIFLIGFWYFFTPLLILMVVGLWKLKSNSQKIVSYFFLTCFFIITVFSRTISPRYLVAFTPLVSIFASYAFSLYKPRWVITKYILLGIVAAVPFSLTALLILNPLKYFFTLSRFTKQSQITDYVSNWTSGYGVREAITYLQSLAEKGPLTVGVRVDAGNPESAVFAYFYNSKKVTPAYFDAKYLDPVILKYDCLKTDIPFYFIARDGNLAGMDKFLFEEKVFRKPEGNNFVSLYSLKTSCKGSILKL